MNIFKFHQKFKTLNANYIINFLRNSYTNVVDVNKLEYNEYGNPETVLKLVNSTLNKKLEDDNILVKFISAVIHPSDINTVQGIYPIKPSLPAVLGNEGFGEILEVGKNVNLKPGDYVVPKHSNSGTITTYKVFKECDVLKVPPVKDALIGAVMSINPGTAYRMLFDFVSLKSGDWMIQTGGTSAVGIYATQIAKKLGVKSLSIIRARKTEEATDKVKSVLMKYGADIVVTESEAKEACSKISAKLALNCVGGRAALPLLRGLSEGGIMVTYGGMNAQPMTVPVSSFIFSDVSLRGFWMSRWNATNQNDEKRQKMLEVLATGFNEEWLRPSPYQQFDLINDWQEAVRASTFRNDIPDELSKKCIIMMPP